ncbi:MAG: IS4 family transposase [Deltaproteobacteria bacterium]|nr:IS4 family transposase [Deltaproteobacteria bacterium]
MPYTMEPQRRKKKARSFHQLTKPLRKILKKITPLLARGNRDLQMTFEDQLNALIYFHLEEHSSGRHLLQVLEEDEFARDNIAPQDGIKKSSFFEAINSRGLEQLLQVFEALYAEASSVLPKEYSQLGDLCVIDGSLIDAVLSMYWADYRQGSKKAKVHIGFDPHRSVPSKIFLTDGKGDERPFVAQILSPGQTGVMDRYYQCHKNFDQWQEDQKHFICRIKVKTTKTLIQNQAVNSGSLVFYDAIVLLGTPGVNQTQKPLRVVGYRVDSVDYWVATDRFDLTADQIAFAYKLRWTIETFFGWWKRHLKVYHLIARSQHGLMVQILGGLITYILLATYCHDQYREKVSIHRVRELRIKIKNETLAMEETSQSLSSEDHQVFPQALFAKT